ncbi:DUF2336 domain-containing protein [Blastochloris tepida]|uniref:DUF2336 domain-containing protein n=1 Tax=Blastochloris tepida TaxID=2233851 RepID=A0A348G2M9_9HYPH|nr:DUF2336 domain-containing protein [Blastochloris tepida]BBF93812.1 hypothetical protein BLTE_24970 [Blastochloris tepida]
MAAIARESLIIDLEDAIIRGSAGRRIEVLRQITDLFFAGAEVYDDEQIALFDDVIGRLANAIETEARIELASRLAPAENAPPRVIRQLARDDLIDVAGPVLSQSPRLTDDDLIDIARTKSQPHLLAISERETISPPVTDVLVARGNREVMHTVAANSGARFTDKGLSCLVDRSDGDESLQMAIGRRRDLPPQLFRALIAKATQAVQKRLLAIANPLDAREVQRVLASVADRIGEAVAPAKRDFTAAKRNVETLVSRSALNEIALHNFARNGRFEETLVALAELTGVPLEVAERLLLGSQPDPVLILGKAAGFTWQTVRAIILVRPGAQEMPQAALEKALSHFECLSVQTAQRVVRFWRVRRNTLTATAG